MTLSWYIQQFLEKIGFSEIKALQWEIKIQNLEDWIKRRPITSVQVTFDPISDNSFHQYNMKVDKLQMKHTKGIWQKHFTFYGNAEKVDE